MNVVATANKDGSLDLLCKQGKTLTWTWTLFTDSTLTTPMDLTGYSARGQVRKKYADVTSQGSWTCTIPNPTDGTVHNLMDAITSAGIPAGETAQDVNKSVYVYEIEIYIGSPEVVIASIGGKYFNAPTAIKTT